MHITGHSIPHTMSYFRFSTEKHTCNWTNFYSRTVRLLFLYKQLLYNELLTSSPILHGVQQIFLINVSLAVCVHIKQAYIYPCMPLILPSTFTQRLWQPAANIIAVYFREWWSTITVFWQFIVPIR